MHRGRPKTDTRSRSLYKEQTLPRIHYYHLVNRGFTLPGSGNLLYCVPYNGVFL